MAGNFFGDLGKSVTKAVRKAADQTGSALESAKLNAKIGTARKEIDKLCRQIGEEVYSRIAEGEEPVGPEVMSCVEDIRAQKDRIRSLRESLAAVQGRKVCPACGDIIASDVAFCPRCGAPVPVMDEEDLFEAEAEDVSGLQEEGSDVQAETDGGVEFITIEDAEQPEEDAAEPEEDGEPEEDTDKTL